MSHRYARSGDAALREVDLEVPDGSLVAVIGPSGSGKSTLVRVAAGFEPLTSGAILLDGRDVAASAPEDRDLTVMFQRPLLFDHLDVLGNVAFAPRVSGLTRREARRRASRYLDLVRMADHERRAVTTLSGGQQQRVALARALAAERGVLLLDEPFSSLDRELREGMHEVLADVRDALRPTVVLVTHDLAEAGLADRVAVLVDGRIEQVAPMVSLYRRPASLRVARLLGGFTEVDGTTTDGVHHSRWGHVDVVSDVAAGPAVLVLRREDLVVEVPAEGAPVAGGTGFGVDGTVGRLRAEGARIVAVVHGDDGSRVEIDDVGPTVRRGDRARVRLRPGVAPVAVPPDAPILTSATDA